MEDRLGGSACLLSVALPTNPLCYAGRRLQNSRPYICVFKYARAVKQKVWNEAENRENAFTDFFTDFEKKKTTVLQSTFVRAQIFTISKLLPGVVNR